MPQKAQILLVGQLSSQEMEKKFVALMALRKFMPEQGLEDHCPEELSSNLSDTPEEANQCLQDH